MLQLCFVEEWVSRDALENLLTLRPGSRALHVTMFARRALPCGAADASSALQTALLLSSLATFVAGAAPGGPAAVASLARRLAPLETLDDVKTQTGLMLAAYVLQYAVLGGLFEGTHPQGALSSTLPAAAVKARRAQVWFEVRTGVLSLVITVALAVLWGYAVEPRLWTFAFFETHEWTPGWGVLGLVAYIACFDTWFYWSHWALHEFESLWHSVRESGDGETRRGARGPADDCPRS